MKKTAFIPKFRNGVFAAFVVGLIILITVGILSYKNAKLERTSREAVAHTYQVLATIDSVETNIIGAESKQRNFLLTGDAARLSTYQQNVIGVSLAVNSLRELTKDNPVQQHNIDLLEFLTTARIERLHNGIEMRKQYGIAGSIQVVQEGKGAALMRELKSRLSNMKEEEGKLLTERTNKADAAFRKTLLAIVFGYVFAVALLFMSGMALTRELRDHEFAEKTLRESEERFRLVVADVTIYAILTLDPEGNVATWNAGAERIKGYAAEEIIGKHFSCFYLPEDIAAGKPDKELKGALTHGRYEDEGWRVRKNGSLFWANVVVTAMRGAAGHLIGFSKVTRDLTERKKSEENIKSLNQDLGQHVAELTAANRELDAFTYSLAHDLRAPLRHVNGFANILHEEHRQHLNAEGQRVLNKILKSSKDMGVLIDELLGFARLGRKELELTSVNLQSLVEEIRQQLEPETQDRVLAWEINLLPSVCGDKALLRQVLINLISNAVKYSAKKAVAHIEIGTRNGGSDVTVFVRDDGDGFDMRYAEKLFRVFQRLHRAEDFEGTGIGLANVRRIVERHGGRVWAEGEPGLGATFYFTLPMKEMT
jgi:PAS domain S-box-containing protein